MASFELLSSSHDGHIRALAKAIIMASKISKEALLEFTTEKMRLCARTDMLLVKFTFSRTFFNEYNCDRKHRCFVNLKALSMPFKSSILIANDGNLRANQIKLKCFVEDELNNRIVFKIGADPPAATLTYRLPINDLDPDRMSSLNAINRTIDYARVEISPKGTKRDKFLLSAFTNFAPDIDQVTIRASHSQVRFIGSTSPLSRSATATSLATSEFTHSKDDFSIYNVKEEVNITVPLRCLKLFLNFVETTKIQTFPKYVFEGMGLPAHFIYDASFYKAHFVSSTPFEYIPDEIECGNPLPIAYGEPNESFIGDENVIQAEDENNYYGLSEAYQDNVENEVDEDEDELEEEDAYNDNQSDCSDFMDGNLENIRATPTGMTTSTAYQHPHPQTTNNNNHSIAGTEFSIRSEMKSNVVYDPEKVREIFDFDQDPDEIENRDCYYSSDEE